MVSQNRQLEEAKSTIKHPADVNEWPHHQFYHTTECRSSLAQGLERLARKREVLGSNVVDEDGGSEAVAPVQSWANS